VAAVYCAVAPVVGGQLVTARPNVGCVPLRDLESCKEAAGDSFNQPYCFPWFPPPATLTTRHPLPIFCCLLPTDSNDPRLPELERQVRAALQLPADAHFMPSRCLHVPVLALTTYGPLPPYAVPLLLLFTDSHDPRLPELERQVRAGLQLPVDAPLLWNRLRDELACLQAEGLTPPAGAAQQQLVRRIDYVTTQRRVSWLLASEQFQSLTSCLHASWVRACLWCSSYGRSTVETASVASCA
jgi:hypothetical protein